jgi:hypothetical protein
MVREEVGMAQAEAEASGGAPPYIAFRTLIDTVDRMAKEGAPSRVDKSYLENFSGGYQTQVIAAFESLRLLEAEGRLSDRFKALVTADEAERKRLISQMVREQYGDVLALGTNATQLQLMDAFENMRIKGDTRRKAIAFFLKAAEYGGVSTSPHWKTPGASQRRAATRATQRTTAKRARGARGSEDEQQQPPPPASTAENVHSIRLRSGEELTLKLTGNLLVMPRDDRNFVFGLIDMMQDYQDGVDTDSEEEEEEEEAEG